MTVFVLSSGDCGESRVHGVFSSMESAENYALELKEEDGPIKWGYHSVSISGYELDHP